MLGSIPVQHLIDVVLLLRSHSVKLFFGKVLERLTESGRISGLVVDATGADGLPFEFLGHQHPSVLDHASRLETALWTYERETMLRTLVVQQVHTRRIL